MYAWTALRIVSKREVAVGATRTSTEHTMPIESIYRPEIQKKRLL